MTDKQRKFCDEYLIDANATRAYKAAYQHIKSEDAARACASRLLTNANIKNYIDEQLDKISSDKIADAKEVMEYLTSVMRREKKESVVVTLSKEKSTYVPDENGTMRKQTVKEDVAQVVNIPTRLSDSNKAAELLGKAYRIYTDKVEVEADMELNINIDYGDDDE